MHKSIVEIIGPRPPFYKIADFLWGKGSCIDSDGNSHYPEATDWTELSLQLRSEWLKPGDMMSRVDVDPTDAYEENPKYLKVMSENKELVDQVVLYLTEYGSVKLVPNRFSSDN